MISQSEQSKCPCVWDGIVCCGVHFQKMPEFSPELLNLSRNFSNTNQNNQSGRFPVFQEELEWQKNHKMNKNILKLSTKTWLNVFNEW